MLTAADLTRMQADLAEIIGDNDVSLVLRRGSTSLAAQTFRVERMGAGRGTRIRRPGSEEARGSILLVGDLTADVQKDDRFTYSGEHFRVILVRPNELQGIQAEAEVAQ